MRRREGRRIWFTRGLGPGSWDDLFHEVRVLSAGKLLALLPLRVVVVKGRRQHSIREEPTAEKQRHTETGTIN